MRTTVSLLRHGEVYNPDGILYGRAPGFHLSARGRAMAERVAERIGERDITVITASPLERAQETAAPLAAARGVEVGLDERLLESDNYFAGRPFKVADLLRPAVWPRLRNPFRPSWGEPYKLQAARVTEAVQDARAKAIELGGDGAEAILVCHQLPIWAARLSAEGRPLWHDPRKRECTLTSLTSLVFGDDGALLRVEYSEPAAALLPGASSTPGA